MGERLPHPQRERAFPLELLEDGECPEPAVLVVDGDDASGVREPDPVPRGFDHLFVRRPHVDVAEMPGALLAQHTGRLALLVALDDSAGNLEVAVGVSEGGGVEPERVVVARHERGGNVAGDGVEVVLGRVDGRGPVAASPAEPPSQRPAGTEPTASPTRASASSSERVPSRRTWRWASAHVGKWTCESVKPGRTQRPPRSTRSGLARAVSCVPTPRQRALRRSPGRSLCGGPGRGCE